MNTSFFVVLIILIAAAVWTVPVKSGLAGGGSTCTYRFDYINFETFEKAFSARVVFNATGYFSSLNSYRWFEDGEMGACAPPGEQDETGVESFSVDTGMIEYRLDSAEHGVSLLYSHFPIGIKYHELGPIRDFFPRFFEYFAFETEDGRFYPCCVDAPCACVCHDTGIGEDIEVFCIDSVAPLNCTEEQFFPDSPPDAILTMKPDGEVNVEGENRFWFEAYTWIFSNSSDRHASVVRNEIIYREEFDIPVNYTDAMCFSEFGGGEDGCIFMRPDSQLSTEIFMGPALGQAQRLSLEIDYWSLPESDGGLCVYFDYDGIDTNSAFPAVPTLDKVWCGDVLPYDSFKQTLVVNLTLNYGPAHSGINYVMTPTNGSSRSRPFVIETRGRASIVLYDVRIKATGAAYHCLDREWPARRDANKGAEPWWWQGVKLPQHDFDVFLVSD